MISVAMTTYNGEKYIKDQLESILNQILKVDEIVIFDDCSTDNTVKIIQSIIENNKTQTSIILNINAENMGYIDNFRQAIAATNGDYIFLSDQDDIWYNDKTQIIMKYIQQESIDVVCTQYNLIDSEGKVLEDSDYKISGSKKIGNKDVAKISFKRLLYGNIVPGCTYCFKKSIKDLYLREINNPIIHDYSIMFIGAIRGKCAYLNKKTMKYRIHNNNSIGIEKKNEKAHFQFQKRKKPYIIEFLENYYDIMSFRKKIMANIILYLRLPVIKVYLKNFLIRGK